MQGRGNHYERAFSRLLRTRGVACLPVDETRRSLHGGLPVKSLDFIVAAPTGAILLVDVKGRTAPSRGSALQNWVTTDDIRSLDIWKATFGANALALLAFVYKLPADDGGGTAFADRVEEGERRYGCLGISLSDYCARLRVRSPRWQTVCVPCGHFQDRARPISYWLAEEPTCKPSGAQGLRNSAGSLMGRSERVADLRAAGSGCSTLRVN